MMFNLFDGSRTKKAAMVLAVIEIVKAFCLMFDIAFDEEVVHAIEVLVGTAIAWFMRSGIKSAESEVKKTLEQRLKEAAQ
jgi:uncharacterized membrane protein